MLPSPQAVGGLASLLMRLAPVESSELLLDLPQRIQLRHDLTESFRLFVGND